MKFKKFLEVVMPIKTMACYSFTATMCLYTVFAYFAQCTITVQTVFAFLLLSAVGACLQTVAFTPLIIKKLPYALRLFVFAVPYFLLLALAAYLCRWVPFDVPGAWIIFFGIFTIIFVLLTIGFEIYFRISGKRYDGLLGAYQERRKKKPQA